jgi:hypothetical protein
MEYTGTANVWSDPLSSWGGGGVDWTANTNWAHTTEGTSTASLTTSWVDYEIEGLTLQTGTTQVNFAIIIAHDTVGYTNGMNIDVADVQVTPTAVNGSFERRSFQQDLQDSFPFYQKTFNYATAPAQNTGTQQGVATGAGVNTADMGGFVTWNLPHPLFTVPASVTTYNPNAANANMRVIDGPSVGSDVTINSTLLGQSRITFLQPTITAGVLDGTLGVHADAEIDI